MENDILDSLTDIGYDGPLLQEPALIKAIDGGPKSPEYTKLVHTLADELKQLCNLEESVNPIENAEESNTFLLELSSFLKELGCPYSKLVTGHLSSRLQNQEDSTLLLEYLLSELMAARMVNVDKPKNAAASMEIVVQESPTAKDLKDILIALKFNKPPPNITVQILFSKLKEKLQDTIQKDGETLVGKPLYNKAMTEKQWRELEVSFAELLEEYRLRREMLLTRLECTIQSFEWSDRLKSKKDQIQAVYRPIRNTLKVKPDVKLSDFLAARSSLLLVEKTSSASVRKNTKSDVNKVLIGRVPDRGGRPQDQQPPPPEMPSWQKRDSNRSIGAGTARRGEGGPGHLAGRGGRGGRVQGGYNQGEHRPQNNAGYNNQQQPQRNYQTFEVPAGGYRNQGDNGYNQSGHHQGYNQSGHNQGYNQSGHNQGGYNQGGHNQGGYNQGGHNQGGYNRGYQGGQHQNQGGNQGGYNQGYDSAGSFNQGGYQGGGNKQRGGYRGGYQNEHDDRDRRGRSNYNRGGRR